MRKFFQVFVTIQDNDNYIILVRDNFPKKLHVEYVQNNKNDNLLAAVKSFFTPDKTAYVESKQLPNSEIKNQNIFYSYNQTNYPLSIKCDFPNKRKKTSIKKIDGKTRSQNYPCEYQELMTHRFKKQFEHSFITPLPHQRVFLEQLWLRIGKMEFFQNENQAFFLMFWTMGSGKSIGALQIFSFVHVPKVFIICQNTMIRQWVTFIKNMPQPDKTSTEFHIIGLTEFGRLSYETKNFLKNQYVIFDEAHLFRNKTENMTTQIDALRQCKLLLNLTGTPIINSIQELVPLALIHGAKITSAEEKMFNDLSDQQKNAHTKTNKCEDDSVKNQTKKHRENKQIDKQKTVLKDFIQKHFHNKVFFYDPKVSPIHMKDYPPFRMVISEVVMTLQQTVDYLVQKRQTFTIGDLSVTHGHRNAYHSTEKAISNSSSSSPSPKFAIIAKNVVKFEDGFPQVVFSNLIYNGINPLKEEIDKEIKDKVKLRIEVTTGQIPVSERNMLFEEYNNRQVDVLLMCRIGESGVNLLGTKALHLADCCENYQLEQQVIAEF